MTEEERYQAASDEEEAIEEIETNIVGLTPEEIARRRYEKRARQRQQRKKSNGKKRQSR